MAGREQDEDANEIENEQTLMMPAVEASDETADADRTAASSEDAASAETPELAGDDEVFEQAPVVAVVELSGPGDGNVSLIVGGVGEIGRLAPELSVRLPHDQWVSRVHARITFRRDGWTLEDLNSSNGSWIENGRTRVRQPIAIALGQVFRVGHTDLMLTDDPDIVLSHGDSR
jgi:pSer/pThr/pTyr-binding forkhead associated (FHA) protein